MPDPEFETADGLAMTVLIGQIIEQLVEIEVLRPTDKQRIIHEALKHLARIGTKQADLAHNLIIDALGAPGRKRR